VKVKSQGEGKTLPPGGKSTQSQNDNASPAYSGPGVEIKRKYLREKLKAVKTENGLYRVYKNRVLSKQRVLEVANLAGFRGTEKKGNLPVTRKRGLELSSEKTEKESENFSVAA